MHGQKNIKQSVCQVKENSTTRTNCNWSHKRNSGCTTKETKSQQCICTADSHI